MPQPELAPRTVKPRIVALEELSADSTMEMLAEARTLLLEYGQYLLDSRLAGFCYGTLEKEAERLPFSYTERGGGCLIARVDGMAAGFLAWRDISSGATPDAWELKRLWVRSEARGLSLGRTLTQAALDRAASAQRKAVYLDTVPAALPAAHRLYLDMGFLPCPRYNDNPVEEVQYFVKFL
jgi:GNAT superfamily N-acetyltransferase